MKESTCNYKTNYTLVEGETYKIKNERSQKLNEEKYI